MMKKIYSLFIAASLSASTTFAQEDKLEIIGTMQYCQAGQIFYERCMPKDASTHKIFERNLAKITALALQAVKETNPSMSDFEISELYWARKDILEKSLSRSIDQRGCEAERGYQKRYEACVSWQP